MWSNQSAAGSRTLQSHPCLHFYPVYLFLSISHLRSLPLSLWPHADSLADGTATVGTAWDWHASRTSSLWTDVSLETSASLYGREIKAPSCSTILTGSPLFSPNWTGSFNSNSLRYENPPGLTHTPPPPPRWISVLSATSLVEAKQTVHETPKAQSQWDRLFIALLQPGSLLLPHV